MQCIISLVSWKGGVGKSTLSTALASLLGASLESGAVLVDLEPWGAATTWWAGQQGSALWQAPGDAPVLRAIATGRTPRPRRGEAGRPRLVPSHQQLLTLTSPHASSSIAAWAWTAEGVPTLMVPTSAGPRPLDRALADALRQWSLEWNCPVVVDTPAGFSALADGAVAASDVTVLPVTPDQWAVPALTKFMSAYAGRITRGLVVPNRVRPRVGDMAWVDFLRSDGIVPEPFVLGPAVLESEVIHVSRRPLHAGPVPGAARAEAINQISGLAEVVLQLAAASTSPMHAAAL